jgi:hypothetical protein
VDPSKGVVKWSAQRAHQHLQAVVTAAVAIPLATTVAGLFLALPEHPTAAERIVQAAEGLGLGLIVVALLAFLYAILRAPYEMRRALRKELTASQGELKDFLDSIHETLELEALDIKRGCPDRGRPDMFNSLEFILRFRNEAAVPIKYSMQHISAEVNGITVPGPDTRTESYRIGPGASGNYVFGSNLPAQEGPAIGKLHYRVWYGPRAEPELFEQDYYLDFRNFPQMDPNRSSTSYWREPGGHDERRAMPSGH